MGYVLAWRGGRAALGRFLRRRHWRAGGSLLARAALTPRTFASSAFASSFFGSSFFG